METLLRDIRYGIRSLLKRPGFAAIAVITLALGIGANTAIFSLVNMVLLRSLPVDHPEQVVAVSMRGKGDSFNAFSYPNYIDFRDRNVVLSGLLAYRFVPMSLSRGGNNERIWGYEVSGNYFDMLGVQAIKGRTFLPEEDRTRLSHPVAVVSYGCWQRRFGADPNLVGKDVLLNNHQFRVIGVAPEGFKGTEFVYTPEIWIPAAMLEWVEPGAKFLDDRSTANFFAVGRLKPGISTTQGEASLNLLAQQLAKEYPDTNEGQSVRLGPPGFILPDLRGAVVSFTWVLMAAVALVLLVTCTNLAGLLLARATDRRKEIAIRLAMGANRLRLIRQLLTESILLSVVGGAVGLWLALWMINALLAFKPPSRLPVGYRCQRRLARAWFFLHRLSPYRRHIRAGTGVTGHPSKSRNRLERYRCSGRRAPFATAERIGCRTNRVVIGPSDWRGISRAYFAATANDESRLRSPQCLNAVVRFGSARLRPGAR